MIADIPNALPGGSTNMVEGLYRGWDEVRTVPSGQQSGLRVIVLFTDGASNSVPGVYPGSTNAKGLRTYDFPENPLTAVPWLPSQSYHQYGRSAGRPTSFPLQTSSLTVNGSSQSSVRGLRNWNSTQLRYPAEVFIINNAARNLVEIIANAARSDTGDYPIRIYTIGMGELVRYNLGTMPEKPEDILKRVANDSTSPDFDEDQLEGKYYFAQTGADVGPAFQQLQNQIIRLSK
jgi:hypothetical protein